MIGQIACAVAALMATIATGLGQQLPSGEVSTVIPVQFRSTVDAAKARPGDRVLVNTIETSFVNGRELPKNSPIVGHVVEARAFRFDPAPYAVQEPSYLSIHFDTAVVGGASVPVVMSVRVLADPVDSMRARTVQYYDEHDPQGTLVQIGGDSFRPREERVFSATGDIVGYNRKAGVFARLLPGDYTSRYSHLTCDGSGVAEEPVAIFSANACGLYGFDQLYLLDNGRGGNGTFRLESRRRTVKLYGRSTALLQVVR